MSESAERYSPPHSVDAEKALLGAIFRRSEAFHAVNDKVHLQPENFFVDTHRLIYNAIVDLDSQSQIIDVISVGEQLLRDSGGDRFNHSYLMDLMDSAPLSQNVIHYAEIIKEKYFLRRVISTCEETSKKASASQCKISEFIESVEKEFLKISHEHDSSGGLVNAPNILIPTLEEIERRIASEGSITGLSSGFTDLDHYTGGWQKSDLVILAARPGMGKTALALNWCLNAVKSRDDAIAGIFTLEMSKEQLMERLLASEARIDSVSLRKGLLTEEDQDRLMEGARRIHTLGDRLVVDETPGISLGELRSRCRRYKREHGLDIVVIDYLQLMTGSATAQKQGREREIGEISMGLKALAKELAVPVIALAQLNRGPDARPDKRPKISDLRESGSMEQDADQILFVYRDDYYNPNSEFAGKAEILVAKNRHGETGSAYLAWLPNFVSFHNLMNEA